MNANLLSALKAYTALIGAVITGVVGITTPDSPEYKVLTIILAVCTAIATFVVPNQQMARALTRKDERGVYEPGGALYILAIVFVVIVILLLLGFIR